jgi:NTE family protein
VIFSARFNTTLDSELPTYGLFTGGGFFNMSGFEQNELIGQHFGMVLAGYRHNLGESGLLPAYAGFTVEYGNAGVKRRDVFGDGILNGSIYAAYDSPLGPIYVGYGLADERSGLFFLRLGNILSRNTLGR